MQLHAVGSYTSAGTVALIAAPGSGSRIVIDNLHISAGTAGAVTVGFSATNERVFHLAANAGAEESVMGWQGDANAAFSVTAPATGPTEVTVDYHVEDAP